ncbi:EAL domain-containing protein [Oxalobacteraceae bacterium R-40]|uniref:EAL domain-containing protein n=1 Tax=Keguizhuia sedimenti TaxID=3064264 RepID=A0ABU1BTI1_9BURK|nr:EAL domain-containing protein [Oxalobacteraceae bacterium R-40]
MNSRLSRSLSKLSAVRLFHLSMPVLYAGLLLQLLQLFLQSGISGVSWTDPSMLAASLLFVLFLVGITRSFRPQWILTNSRAAVFELLGLLTSIAVFASTQANFRVPLPAVIMMSALFPLIFSARIALLCVLLAASGATLMQSRGLISYDGSALSVASVLCVGLIAILLKRALDLHAAAVKQARMNERRFNAIARATRHVFMIADAGYRIKYANPALQEVVGYTKEEIEQDNVWPAVHPDDAQAHQEKLRYLRDRPRSKIFSRHRSRHKDGHWVWLETRGYNMLHDPAINGLVFSVEDITARKDAERKLESEHALLRAVLDLNPAMIYAKDTEGRFTISNSSFHRQFGYASEDELRGKKVHELIAAQLGSGQERHVARIGDALHLQDIEVIQSGIPLREIETQGFWEGDERRWYRSNKYPLHDADQRIVGMIGITRDITERKEYELRLEHQAHHDFLTGLPNRRYLLKKINEEIARAKGIPARTSVLFCDLDFFKSVNDTHGHEVGDKCLVELTHRIRMALPEVDFVCRYGGDEFVILTHVPLPDATVKAQQLIQVLSQPMIAGDVIVKIQASIGVAQLRPTHKSASELIHDADAAMYQAKERGRSRVETFSLTLQHNATKRAQMDVALRFALDRDELSLCYQPKVSLIDGSVLGFELLLRWRSEEYGDIPPSEFIPIAESSGIIIPIGLWVLEQACWQLNRWQSEAGDRNHLTVAVNVSMRQLMQPSFLSDVAEILARTGIAASSLELEVTETSAMANPAQTAETMAALKTLGIRLALDDFGTGYSSLAYLQSLPIDVLKIDKTFVSHLGKQQNDDAIVRLIIALAKTLHLEIVAEGVENKAQMHELQKLGCLIGQGHYFSPPMKQHEAEKLLRANRQFLQA